MKQFAEFLPIAIFVGAYVWTRDILFSTAVLIGAQVVLVAVLFARERSLSGQMKFQTALVVAFGGATLLYRDPAFIQWKPTVLYWFFAVALAGSDLFGERNLIERAVGAELDLPRAVWRRLAWAWAALFAAFGVLNLFVVYNYSEETWVAFKLIGGIGMTVVGIIGSVAWLHFAGHLAQLEEAESEGADASAPAPAPATDAADR